MPPEVKQMIKEQEEEKILKEFEELGYSHIEYSFDKNVLMMLNPKCEEYITIDLVEKYYSCYFENGGCSKLSLEVHQLLHKLFEIWGWL